MRIGFHGRLEDAPQIRAGFIGCGSHAFRNIYPTFQFAPVNLVATCDLDLEKAKAFAHQFGATSAYASHEEMLAREKLDAVFIVTGYDQQGRPLYPRLADDCLRAGCHVWIEKPPAACCADIEAMQRASGETNRIVMIGLKKIFFPSLEKAKALMQESEFGAVQLVSTSYPQYVPHAEEIRRYLHDVERVPSVVGFLDHLCHPMSRLVYLLGMPKTLYYERTAAGAGSATFTYESGAVAMLALTHGQSNNGGMEHTLIVGESGRHLTIENNIRLTSHRNPALSGGYGATTSFFDGPEHATSAVWEPEFSLGQLYNKGLFLLGYAQEIDEFARCVLDNRQPERGTLEQAWQVTRVFEAFAEGPGQVIQLTPRTKETMPC